MKIKTKHLFIFPFVLNTYQTRPETPKVRTILICLSQSCCFLFGVCHCFCQADTFSTALMSALLSSVLQPLMSESCLPPAFVKLFHNTYQVNVGSPWLRKFWAINFISTMRGALGLVRTPIYFLTQLLFILCLNNIRPSCAVPPWSSPSPLSPLLSQARPIQQGSCCIYQPAH